MDRNVPVAAVGKYLAALCVAITNFVQTSPPLIRDQVLVLIGLIVVDTFTGVWAAGHEQRVSSREMMKGVKAKMLQYTLIVTLFSGAALMGHNWYILSAGFGILTTVEVSSNFENLIRLHNLGGADFGVFKPMLDRAAKYFVVGQLPQAVVTTIIAPVSAEEKDHV